MADLLKPIAPSSFYLEFDGLTDLVFKTVTLPEYKPKVAGGEAIIGSTKDGKTIRQVNSGGFEGLFTFDVVCIASLTGSSASKKMYEWFEKCLPKSDGGKGEWKKNKKTGKISAFDSDSELVAMWEFSESWPSSYKCADLDVTQDAYLEETFTITCEKFNRTK
ncbi:phage tail protein [Ancylothrix sp. C2]|uniref:phage tail protein n=1 Tax=Ancylothrix sp. D3o TaxID=2953691 RepID=UPI0021BB4236|nr:phage tail protein [Ancylothrix sp. D3o]MCT7948247.1 phage tail protein [Ancylothrix sp. D3o]